MGAVLVVEPAEQGKPHLGIGEVVKCPNDQILHTKPPKGYRASGKLLNGTWDEIDYKMFVE